MERILNLASLIFLITVGSALGGMLIFFIGVKIGDLLDLAERNYGLKALLFLLLVIVAFVSFVLAGISVAFGVLA